MTPKQKLICTLISICFFFVGVLFATSVFWVTSLIQVPEIPIASVIEKLTLFGSVPLTMLSILLMFIIMGD